MALFKTILKTLVLPTLLLTGCDRQEIFVKRDMLYLDFEMDRAECETTAIQDIDSTHTRSAELSVSTFKIAFGRKDGNAAARVRNYEACMLSKGYRRVEMPKCSDRRAARLHGVGPLSVNDRVELGTRSCVSNDRRGRVVFFER